MDSDQNAKDSNAMGKRQKTLSLNDQLCELVQAYADKRGTNFQRVTQAALLQFFFDHVSGPDDAWLGLSTSLEKGQIDLPAVPIKAFEDFAKDLENKLALRRQKESPEGAWDKWAEAKIAAAYSDAGVWRTSTHMFGGSGDSMEGLIAFVLSESLRDDLDHVIAPAEDEQNTPGNS